MINAGKCYYPFGILVSAPDFIFVILQSPVYTDKKIYNGAKNICNNITNKYITGPNVTKLSSLGFDDNNYCREGLRVY